VGAQPVEYVCARPGGCRGYPAAASRRVTSTAFATVASQLRRVRRHLDGLCLGLPATVSRARLPRRAVPWFTSHGVACAVTSTAVPWFTRRRCRVRGYLDGCALVHPPRCRVRPNLDGCALVYLPRCRVSGYLDGCGHGHFGGCATVARRSCRAQLPRARRGRLPSQARGLPGARYIGACTPITIVRQCGRRQTEGHATMQPCT
jgi:hypothetical protein